METVHSITEEHYRTETGGSIRHRRTEQVNNYIEKIQLNMLSASLNEKDVVIKKLLANEASLLIKTNNSIYKVIYIKDIDKVIESLDSIIKVGD